MSCASTGPDTSVPLSLFVGPDPYASRGAGVGGGNTAYLGAAISALSAHRLQAERRSLSDAEGEGAVSVSTREDNVTLPAPRRAEPSRAGRPAIDRKVSRVRASRSLTRAAVRRAVHASVCEICPT